MQEPYQLDDDDATDHPDKRGQKCFNDADSRYIRASPRSQRPHLFASRDSSSSFRLLFTLPPTYYRIWGLEKRMGLHSNGCGTICKYLKWIRAPVVFRRWKCGLMPAQQRTYFPASLLTWAMLVRCGTICRLSNAIYLKQGKLRSNDYVAWIGDSTVCNLHVSLSLKQEKSINRAECAKKKLRVRRGRCCR